MTPSLRTRLALSQIFLVFAALLTVTVLAIVEQRQWLLTSHVDRLEREARAVEARLADAAEPLPGDFEDRAQALGRLLGVRVTLIDSTGRVVGDSDVPRAELPQVENHAGRPEVRAALAGRVGHATRVSATV
jgi:two-component system phosphate regulon sensor histidine kinase PhoR